MPDLSPAEAAQDLGIATNTLRTWAREFAPFLSSEVEALRLLLDAQRGTLEAQRSTLEAQSQLIAQLQQQHGEDRLALDQAQQQIVDTRADLVAQLAEVRAQLLKVPSWLRVLLGLGA
jgi:hypothetical protein